MVSFQRTFHLFPLLLAMMMSLTAAQETKSENLFSEENDGHDTRKRIVVLIVGSLIAGKLFLLWLIYLAIRRRQYLRAAQNGEEDVCDGKVEAVIAENVTTYATSSESEEDEFVDIELQDPPEPVVPKKT
jgi:hypothetical protein